MTLLKRLLPLLLFALTPLLSFAAEDGTPVPDRRLFTGKETDGAVYFVPQFTEFKEVSENDLLFLRRVIKRAEKEKVKAIIFELDTPGGRVDVALRYLSVFAKSEVPIIAYLNPQGISAGMIIALAADRVAINEQGVIGDAMPLQMDAGGVRPVVAPPEEKEEKKAAPEAAGEQAAGEEGKDAGETGEKPAENTEKPAGKPTKKSKDKSKEEENLSPLMEEIKKLVESRREKDAPAGEESKRLTDQKFLTVFFKILQVLAEKNDRPVKVIRATADPYVKLTKEEDGIDHDGRGPLTMSAKEAKELGVVDYVVRGRNDILAGIGLPDARIEVIEPSGLDQIFHFLAYPGVALLLIAVGIVGIFVEVNTPGFGVPGTLGVAAIVLYFLGQMGVGGFEWGPIVAFFVGIVLLALEIFVIPGFGVVGLLGIVCILGSLVAAMGFDEFETAIQVVGGGILIAALLITVLVIYVLPKSTLFKRFALNTAVGNDPGAEAVAADSQVGRIGTALTALRPAGVIVIDDKRFDATTEGGFIEPGTRVEIVGARNFQLVAKPADKPVPETEKPA